VTLDLLTHAISRACKCHATRCEDRHAPCLQTLSVECSDLNGLALPFFTSIHHHLRQIALRVNPQRLPIAIRIALSVLIIRHALGIADCGGGQVAVVSQSLTTKTHSRSGRLADVSTALTPNRSHTGQ